MPTRLPDYFALDRYAISAVDVVRMAFRCEPSQIDANVLMTPIWSHEVFLNVATLQETVTPERVYTLDYNGSPFTLIRCGVGAPLAGDAMLALGCTPCRRVLFVGSVGGLLWGMRIGDLLVPAESVSGDGFSSYLAAGQLQPDCFLAAAAPDLELLSRLRQIAAPLCVASGAALLDGKVFSSDSIVAQFHHLDEMVSRYGCIGIEMETAAVFRAAQLVGIPAAALLQISDVAPDNKSLFSGRTETEQQRRRQLRRELVSRIAIEALVGPATTPIRFDSS